VKHRVSEIAWRLTIAVAFASIIDHSLHWTT